MSNTPPVRRRPAAVALVLLLAAALPAASLHAQEATQQTHKTYAIAAGPLEDALTRFAASAGIALSFDPALVADLRSPGLNGRHTGAEGLHRLLQGSGLEPVKRSDGGYTLRKLPPTPAGEATLAPVTVRASGLRDVTTEGTGNDGYAARRAGALKGTQSLKETPQSVSVITRQQIETQGVQKVNEALRYTPGVFAETRGASTRYDIPQMRGFGGDGMGGGYRYLDGLRVFNTAYYATPQLDPYTLESVEVIRGPASVLYGQSSPGGLLNLTSKRPPDEARREIQLQAGSHDQYQAAFDVGGPVDDDGHLLYRLVGLGRQGDTQIDHTREARRLIAPSLTWRPSAATELTLLASYQRDPENGWHGWVPAQGTLLPNPVGRVPKHFFDGDPSFDRFDRTQKSLGYLFSHTFDDTWTFRQNLRFMEVEVSDRNVYGQGLTVAGGVPVDYRTLRRGTYRSDESIRALTIDNQLQATFRTGAIDHVLLVGLDYQNVDNEVAIGYGTAPTIDVFDPVYRQHINIPAVTQQIDQQRDQWGLYLQDQIRWNRWISTLSLRHDRASSTTETRNPQTSAAAVRSTQDERAWTGRAGLIYAFDNGVSPYASVATSFEPLLGTDIDGKSFEPTRGRQHEIGVKYQPDGWSGLLTAALFDITQSNLRTSVTDRPGQYRQLGEVKSRGVELEAKFQPAPRLNVIASYTHQDVEITRDMPASTGGTSNQGKTPYLTPSHQAALWADYTLRTGAFAGLTFGGGVRYVGSTWADTANTTRVPSYTLADAMLAYDLGYMGNDLKGATVALNIKNLFDKSYVAGCAGRLTSCYWGNERSILATLNYRW